LKHVETTKKSMLFTKQNHVKTNVVHVVPHVVHVVHKKPQETNKLFVEPLLFTKKPRVCSLKRITVVHGRNHKEHVETTLFIKEPQRN
jgi:hypothetical protein